MPFKFRDVTRSLKKKGFVEDNTHHKYLHFYYQGKLTHLYTLVSQGSGADDVGPDIVKKMKRQLGLGSLKQVERLIECSMAEDEYIKTLVAAKMLPESPKEE